ncbi:alpha/beta fold hydrolase [Nocardiopsis ganjiahuensis]|uniref:alpha/beta fold hydrolase n=1 Tax=Nocardiopsis ganjiahuensis TaxID=239984 RepID=UPI0004783CDD|nr:alpha/beta fold hydrolase [Nocardiopsis ganjiahuensis]
MRSDERMIQAGGVELCTQAFGEAGHPPILLIAGNETSMDWWEDGFCELLAAAGRFVVRYDSRDTGRSTRFPVGEPGYSGEALVHDAIGVLDGWRLPRAHVAGISSGGGIAQYLGVWNADRVASLTLMSTTAVSSGNQHQELPPPAEAVSRSFAEPLPEPDWNDRDAVVEHMVATERVFAGGAPVDPDRIRRIVTRAMERGGGMASAANHWLVAATPLGDRLGEITAPTLVLHGREDPLFPYPHAEALAAEIPGARLHPLSGVGHQHPPPALWDEVVGAIAEHTAPL